METEEDYSILAKKKINFVYKRVSESNWHYLHLTAP